MSAPKTGDAAFRYTLDGQDYIHYLGHPLHQVVANDPEQVFDHVSADLSTIRRVAITSTVTDLTATIRWDGQSQSLRHFFKAARRGASLEYFPSISSPSESYPCVMMGGWEMDLDNDFWWEYRNSAQITLRRTDGGSWQGLTEGTLFYYRAGNDLPGLTFTRSGSVGPYIDEDGVLQSAAADIFRTDWIDTTGDRKMDTPTLLLEPQRINLNDEDDLTQWSTSGTPQVATTDGLDGGAASAYTVEDDAGGSAEYIERAITGFTDSTNVSVVFVVRENTMPASGDQQLILRDASAPANRLLLEITGWTDGEPQITATTGALIGTRHKGGGWWAIYGQATVVTEANSNRVRIVPAATAAQTGSIDVDRVNVYDSSIPGHSILDASETRNADTWYANFPHAPQTLTAYLKLRERGSVDLSSVVGVLKIGDATAGNTPRLLVYMQSNEYRALYETADGSVTLTGLTTAPEYDEEFELRVVLESDALTIGQSIAGAAETTDTDSHSLGFPDAWAGERLYLNSRGDSARGFFAGEVVKVAKGVKTMAEMRAI